ncbi:MAG TPA: hypothetical protein VFV89_07040 [Nocardioides sp.]|uniref:hypothetical protein n=1 Tax=Nocardioides sp. TaxID=35761 RepID=UPI002E366F32|nr:hypothetical protein [Nocardioides sp.]HEX5087547.1 hypothetical protein [Nocardioides sp.]
MPRTAPRRRATRHERVRSLDREPVVVTTAARPAPDPGPDPGPDPAPDPEPMREEVVPGPTGAAAGPELTVSVPDREPVQSRLLVALWVLVVAGGLAALVAAMIPRGPDWLDGAGAVAVVTAYSWALAARTGGRPVIFGGLALVLGLLVLLLDQDYLCTGAAVMTCVVSAVLGVMATTPAVRFSRAARECVVAVVIAAIGAMATIGFDPVVSVVRFEYVTLGLAMLGAFGVVYRLGAGLHGLGRRGLVVVAICGVLLAVTLLYAEMLRRYGSQDLVDHLLGGVRWSRDHLGAFPRPIEAVLGVPALAWGCHMRARRRQGWWLCAFGVAATAPVANALVNPAISLLECGLSVLYALVVGLVIGYVVIRTDLALTGSRGQGGRRLEEAAAVRPEPPRTAALL